MTWTYMCLQKLLSPIRGRCAAGRACLPKEPEPPGNGSSFLEDLRRQRLRIICAVGRTGLQKRFSDNSSNVVGQWKLMRSNSSKGNNYKTFVWSTVTIVFYSSARTLSFRVSSERKIIHVGVRQEWNV